MGYSVSWMAINGKTPENARDELGFSETGEYEEFPEAMFSAAELPNQWYLIHINRCDSPYVSSDTLEFLSKDCELIACVVEEHVMYSRSQYWNNGYKIWQIVHDAQQGGYHLDHEGMLPDDFEKTKARLIAMQNSEGGEAENVDFIFEIPLILADEIAGFKHDEVIPDLKYAVLMSINTRKKPGFVSRWRFW